MFDKDGPKCWLHKQGNFITTFFPKEMKAGEDYDFFYLPGIDEKDVSVTLANGMLTIKGERKAAHEESKDDYYLCERSYGAFERSLRLPDSIDEGKVGVRFDKGVLKVIAEKRPEALKAEKKIEIKKG